MSVKDIKLPEYTVKQDVWNSITHGIGAIFGIVVTILMLIKVCVWGYTGETHTDFVYRIIGISLFGFGMLTCYTISCVYHSLFKNNGKRVLRVIDHDTVYLLIAGTYSAFCLISLRDINLWGVLPHCGWWIAGVCWLGVVLGIVFNSINIHKYIVFTTALYIITGWTIILASNELIATITLPGYLFLLGGGISYTIGAVLYGIGAKKSLWFHTVFHVFIVIGTVLQFVSIWCYVLN
jgi:hemolysin III